MRGDMVEESLKRKWKIALAALAVVVVAVLWWRREPEPSYQGKTVGEWLEEIKPSTTNITGITFPSDPSPNNPAVKAIVAIGRDAAPFLVQRMQRGDSAFRHRLFHWKVRWLQGSGQPDTTDAENACFCLGELGPKAEAVVPDLVAMVNNPESWLEPSIVKLLGDIHVRSEIVVPALTDAFRRSSGFETIWVAMSLGHLGAEAKSAVPILILKWRSSTNENEVYLIAETIEKIDPEAARTAGIEKFRKR
jgi:hypothetical protein